MVVCIGKYRVHRSLGYHELNSLPINPIVLMAPRKKISTFENSVGKGKNSVDLTAYNDFYPSKDKYHLFKLYQILSCAKIKAIQFWSTQTFGYQDQCF